MDALEIKHFPSHLSLKTPLPPLSEREQWPVALQWVHRLIGNDAELSAWSQCLSPSVEPSHTNDDSSDTASAVKAVREKLRQFLHAAD